MSRRRKQDHDLWEKVKATVKPIPSNRAGFARGLNEVLQPEPVSSRPVVSAPRILPKLAIPEPAIKMSLAPKPRVLDPAISRKIAKGRISIDARVDFHGLTQLEAHQRLWRFIDMAFRSGKRTVLVITGKGAQGEGVLRHCVPRWLEGPEFRTFVSGSQEAHIMHGGSGALYVRIQKSYGDMHS